MRHVGARLAISGTSFILNGRTHAALAFVLAEEGVKAGCAPPQRPTAAAPAPHMPEIPTVPRPEPRGLPS